MVWRGDERSKNGSTWQRFLHDVGRFYILHEVINKPGPLTAEKWEVIKKHPTVGAKIVGQIKAWRKSYLLILHHHEQWGGNGYLAGLAGEAFPSGPGSLPWPTPMTP